MSAHDTQGRPVEVWAVVDAREQMIAPEPSEDAANELADAVRAEPGTMYNGINAQLPIRVVRCVGPAEEYEALRAKVEALEKERDGAIDALAWSQNMSSNGEVASLVGMLHDAKSQRDAALAQAAMLRSALEDFGEHASGCVRARFDGGRPTADGGYEMCFAGKWYETKPADRTPACACGLSAALAETPPTEMRTEKEGAE